VTGRIVAIFGNMVIAETNETVFQNSIGHCRRADGAELLSEVIRVRGKRVDLQVFEETRGLKVGDPVELEEEMLSVTLGPGLLGQIYDGLQNPLPRLAEASGFFLKPGMYVDGLDTERKWDFTPTTKAGDTLEAGDPVGTVPEGIFTHQIMVPLSWRGQFTVESVAEAGAYPVTHEVATVADAEGNKHPVTMQQTWPVKRALCVCKERLMPTEPLVTRVRIIDSMFPIVRGGTYCIPGPFGAGKTVLQQITSRHAEVDVVVIAACGERAGEVVETIREFPELVDPRTGKSLMERTIIICNTSAMPVAAREASVYTAVTMAEYYRQMGLDVLLLADSTSRWAQAMREVSGRLEEIPGEEAFPAYLESRIAGFYERAGSVELRDGRIASVTIGGSVSPAGGNFEEPVTQGTLKVVGAFEGLSQARADARRYPAIDPLESWSKYTGIIDPGKVQRVRTLLRRGNEVRQMMTVVGEEGTGDDDFLIMLKAEFFDNCYLQQNAYDEVDSATPKKRQQFVFDKVLQVLDLEIDFGNKDEARGIMVAASDLFRNWNYAAWDVARDEKADAGDELAEDTAVEAPTPGMSDEFKQILAQIEEFIESKPSGARGRRTGRQERDEGGRDCGGEVTSKRWSMTKQ